MVNAKKSPSIITSHPVGAGRVALLLVAVFLSNALWCLFGPLSPMLPGTWPFAIVHPCRAVQSLPLRLVLGRRAAIVAGVRPPEQGRGHAQFSGLHP